MASRPRCSTSVPSISIAFNLRLSDVAEVRPGYEDPPTLLIVRFDKTGTYALLVHGKIVANGNRLTAILPALAVASSTTGET